MRRLITIKLVTPHARIDRDRLAWMCSRGLPILEDRPISEDPKRSRKVYPHARIDQQAQNIVAE